MTPQIICKIQLLKMGNFVPSALPTSPNAEPPREFIRGYLEYPDADFVSGGVSSWVWRLHEDGSALKVPRDYDLKGNKQVIASEASIYQCIGPHPRLVKFIDHSDKGLRLEYMANGNLENYLKNTAGTSVEQRHQWAIQAAEGLDLLHRHGFNHCDCNPRNFLVGNDLDLKIIDFGSSTPTNEPETMEDTRFRLPRDDYEPASPASEAFALTCTIFHIMTGAPPFQQLPSNEVIQLYEKKQHPSLAEIPEPCRTFLERGFAREFTSAGEMLDWLMKNS